jgi:hypothetical protein
MPDTVSAGDPAVWGGRFLRYTTTDPIRKVPTALTTLSLVITDPAGATTTYAIGAFRNPETGRYELDRTHVLPGLWTGVFVATGSFTDEDGNSRSPVWNRTQELLVAAS